MCIVLIVVVVSATFWLALINFLLSLSRKMCLCHCEELEDDDNMVTMMRLSLWR